MTYPALCSKFKMFAGSFAYIMGLNFQLSRHRIRIGVRVAGKQFRGSNSGMRQALENGISQGNDQVEKSLCHRAAESDVVDDGQLGPSVSLKSAAARVGAKRWSPHGLPVKTMALVSKNYLQCMLCQVSPKGDPGAAV